MARYTGPKHKLARREGVNILDKTSASLQRRLNVPPGIHGRKRTKRLSEYGEQLREKQKLKAMYGLLEKQLVKMVNLLEHIKGDTGEQLVSLLETRLDNIVYRLGFAKSRPEARQYVSHGHVTVDGKKVNIPSYRVKPNQVVAISDKFVHNTQIAKNLSEDTAVPEWLEKKAAVGKVVRLPNRDEMEKAIQEQLIVEYYSR